MNNIEWKENAVCYADGKQRFAYKEIQLALHDGNGKSKHIDNLISSNDFQLNEPRIGDYIPKSEIDTEQKYNDAVEVFGLFGIKCDSGSGYEGLRSGLYQNLLVDNKHVYVNVHSDCKDCKRKLTYSQLMAIGKLKRLMDERESKAKKEDGPLKPLQFKFDENLSSSNKYERVIFDRYDDSAHVDVYDVLQAFEVTCPATQHAIKKLLCSGLRGHKDQATDLIEAKESITRAIELHKNK